MLATSKFSGPRGLPWLNKIRNIQNQQFYTSWRFWIEIAQREVKSVVMQNEDVVWRGKQPHILVYFRFCGPTRFQSEESKTETVSAKSRLLTQERQIRLSWKESKAVVFAKVVLKGQGLSKLLTGLATFVLSNFPFNDRLKTYWFSRFCLLPKTQTNQSAESPSVGTLGLMKQLNLKK